MKKLCLILGDQLSNCLSSLKEINKKSDHILFCEVIEEATYVQHHPKKIAFIFSAMRHFAKELQAEGYRIRYVTLEDPNNTGSFSGEVERALHDHDCQQIVVTEPGEWRVAEMFAKWSTQLKVPVTLLKDDRFLCSITEFQRWSKDKKQLRMEFFYREMRKKYKILLEEDGTPCGGHWNYDQQNRKKLNKKITLPNRPTHAQDQLTQSVLKLVSQRFSHHFGDIDGFDFAVTRKQALLELDYFLEQCLPVFGDYQDAMLTGEPYLYHSRLSAYINVGLLFPLEICQRAETQFRNHHAPLNAVEGFIRQIMGWREFVRGLYWQFMPEYRELNYLNASRPLPAFYWGKPTQLFCVSEAVRHTQQHAYSHHIQRLMITGNFALLAGINPTEVCQWYLEVYVDAFEWVELPNTLGMALFADGGKMGSKPYAASGKYIQRMSNFCKSCQYDPNLTIGENACPFNSLYWNFMGTHRSLLHGNPRLNYAYRYWDQLTTSEQQALQHQAALVLSKLADGTL